jgi:hypothetical protein
VSNQTPRISINKLAEFMGAKGARQRQILKDQKYPTDYKGMYHKEAAEAIALAIVSNLEDLGPIERAMALLEQAQPQKIGTQRRFAANLDALETFSLMLDDVDQRIKGLKLSLGDQFAVQRLQIHGVDISVRPEIILRGNGKTGPLCGALKLHFPRTFPLSEDAAGNVSAVAQEWCKTYMPDEGNVAGGFCFVIDVGSQMVYDGAKATIARMKDVQANCQNIAALWPTI